MNFKLRNSIVTKFLIGFGVTVLVTMAAFLFVYDQASGLARRLTYEKMQSRAEYYLRSFDNELDHVGKLQNDFFSDRKLTFIIGPNMNIDDYEKRDCLLSVKERINTVTGVSKIVEDGILYLPKSEYKITSATIDPMRGSDKEEMENYLDFADGMLHYDGTHFFLVKTGMPKIQSNPVPNHVFVLLFSEAEIQKRLGAINTSEDSGAFWYNERENVFIEQSNCESAGRDLLPLLDKDETGAYKNVQRLKRNGKNYLVFVGGYGSLGLFVQYEEETSAIMPILRFRNMSFAAVGLLVILTIVLGFYFAISLRQPIDILLNGFKRVQNGNWKEQIKDVRKDEFSKLYKGFNDMEDQIDRLINEVYVQTNLTQRAQMKQLQAQIAPHFLYNSFFLLSRRIKSHDDENAELLAKHLGHYFQYLTRNESDYVPLKIEEEHARSYAAIQAARFASRIRIEFHELPKDFEQIMVPRLILQPLLENAFEYGLENKIADGLLVVRFEETDGERRIWIEDNGEDTTDEKLWNLSQMLLHGSNGEITGILNIHMRLQNYFHGNGGIRVLRSELGGMAVSVYIGKGGDEFDEKGGRKLLN